MLAYCSRNQENWTMLAVMFAVMGVFLLLKWRAVNAAKPIDFVSFLKQWLGG